MESTLYPSNPTSQNIGEWWGKVLKLYPDPVGYSVPDAEVEGKKK